MLSDNFLLTGFSSNRKLKHGLLKILTNPDVDPKFRELKLNSKLSKKKNSHFET